MNAQIGLQAKRLTCSRGQQILSRNINFHLNSGELLLVEGPKGSGKTSLLRHLAALSSIDEGQILWQGSDIIGNYPAYWQDLHYLGHKQGIKLGLTVDENIKLASCLAEQQEACHSRLRGNDRGHRNDRGYGNDRSLFNENCESTLQLLNLDSYRYTLAAALSAGQKRRLALARLWITKKPLWILDEPLTALDKTSQEIFQHYLEQHLTMGGMCVLSSHQALPMTPSYTLRLPLC